VHDALRGYRALAAQCRLPRVRWHVTVVEGTFAHLAGRLGDARRLARRAVQLLTPSVRNNVAQFFGVQSFLIREEEGRLDEIESAVASAAKTAVNLPIWRAGLALLQVELGKADTAHQLLSDLASQGFANLIRDGNALGTYARLAEAIARLDAAQFAESLLPLLASYADSVVVLANTAGCLGAASRYVGLLAHTLGRLDDAVASFEAALATNERIGAVVQLAHTQRELARSLEARGARGDRERAAALVAEAAAVAARLQLVTLQRRIEADGVAAELTATSVPVVALAAHHTARLRHEGDVWTVTCEGELTRLKDMKGVSYLLELLRHPGQEFHALDLGGAENLRTGDAGEMLDADARRAYKARLTELRDELEEADQHHDVGRAARLREEMEVLAGELSRATGLGGRARKAGSDAERARLNVTRAVRKVVRKIQADCPVLGLHLERSVQTGLFCAYQPDPTFVVDWDL
jgi:tetratricopeptide (TPR) repeat protein